GGCPSKASTSMCCWPLHFIAFHWHPSSLISSTTLTLVGILFLHPFFCRGSGLDSEGPVVVWALCSSLCAAAGTDVSSITRRVFLRHRWDLFGSSSAGSYSGLEVRTLFSTCTRFSSSGSS